MRKQLPPADRRSYLLLQLFRSLFTVALVLFLSQTVDLGTDLSLIMVSSVLGVLIGGALARRYSSPLRVASWHVGALVLYFVALTVTGYVLGGNATDPTRDFLAYRFDLDASLLIAAYGIGLLSTWIFWCLPGMVTFEATVFSIAFVWLLSGHRNYHLDAPKNVSVLAWDLNVAPQHLILSLGALSTILLGLYLILAHSRPVFRRNAPLKEYGRTRRMLTTFIPTALLGLLVALAFYIERNYAQNLTRATNGVGENSKEGESPLGFHSAVGKTRQPAALVRLEGDYAENPWSPMLYLREGALSTFNGRELVLADRAYDTDVPRLSPGQSFALGAAQQDLLKSDGSTRKQLIQSVFLLAKHSSPFAIDFPISLRTMRNPDPQRFELAYQAVSLAPIVKLDSLIGEAVGDERWDKATWEHYLRAPGSTSTKETPETLLDSETPVLDEKGEDLRYHAMASKIAGVDLSAVQRAELIAKFLSEESIYTRTPGHQATDRGDPVAPYLFAKEKRGYCVHFAHAAVYMLRLLGIPARIATGYLTDLTYARDGHILLHLGDRHAWPEIYVRGQGWVVADITPANAENEQVIVPDEKLLQELMNKINPTEELLAPPPLPEEKSHEEKTVLERIARREVILPMLSVALFTIIFLKIWLRFGYLLVPRGRRKARLAYVAFATSMADLGVSRNFGETRREYATRLRDDYNVDAGEITGISELNTFSPTPPKRSGTELNRALGQTFSSLRSSKLRLRRWLGPLSPLSLFRIWKW